MRSEDFYREAAREASAGPAVKTASGHLDLEGREAQRHLKAEHYDELGGPVFADNALKVARDGDKMSDVGLSIMGGHNSKSLHQSMHPDGDETHGATAYERDRARRGAAEATDPWPDAAQVEYRPPVGPDLVPNPASDTSPYDAGWPDPSLTITGPVPSAPQGVRPGSDEPIDPAADVGPYQETTAGRQPTDEDLRERRRQSLIGRSDDGVPLESMLNASPVPIAKGDVGYSREAQAVINCPRCHAAMVRSVSATPVVLASGDRGIYEGYSCQMCGHVVWTHAAPTNDADAEETPDGMWYDGDNPGTDAAREPYKGPGASDEGVQRQPEGVGGIMATGSGAGGLYDDTRTFYEDVADCPQCIAAAQRPENADWGIQEAMDYHEGGHQRTGGTRPLRTAEADGAPNSPEVERDAKHQNLDHRQGWDLSRKIKPEALQRRHEQLHGPAWRVNWKAVGGGYGTEDHPMKGYIDLSPDEDYGGDTADMAKGKFEDLLDADFLGEGKAWSQGVDAASSGVVRARHWSEDEEGPREATPEEMGSWDKIVRVGEPRRISPLPNEHEKRPLGASVAGRADWSMPGAEQDGNEGMKPPKPPKLPSPQVMQRRTEDRVVDAADDYDPEPGR